MRRSIVCSFLLLLALSLSVIHAQDAAPWPPDPADIFAPGVEVVSATPFADDEARLIYVYYDDRWQTFSYPDEFQYVEPSSNYIPFAVSQEQQVFMEVNEGSLEEPAWYMWQLDPAGGTFSRYELLCGQPLGAHTVADMASDWEYYFDAATETYYLCNRQTGEKSAPLPDWVDWWPEYTDNFTGHLPAVSLDGSRIVLYGSVSNPSDGGGCLGVDSVFIAYEIATERFTKLGNGCGDGEVWLERWLTNTQAMVHAGVMGGDVFGRGYYFADLTETNSLTYISEGFKGVPSSQSNNPTLLTVTYSVDTQSGQCRVKAFSINEKTLQEYAFGNDCRRLIVSSDYSYYYLEYEPPSGALTAVMRFDSLTGISTEWTTGEFEQIYSSLNGRYIALVVDDNGQLEPDMWQDMGNARVVVYDVSSGNAPVALESLTELLNSGIRLQWLSDQTFIVIPNNELNSVDSRKRIITLVDGAYREVFVEPDLAAFSLFVSSDNENVFFISESNYEVTSDIVYEQNLFSGQQIAIPIIKSESRQKYNVFLASPERNMGRPEPFPFQLSVFISSQNVTAHHVGFTIALPRLER